MFAAISDAVWMALIAAPVTVLLAWINLRTKKLVEEAVAASIAANAVSEKASAVVVKVEAAVIKVEDTAKTSVDKLDGLIKTSDDTHTLVNSQHGAQLKLGAELSRWKAEQTKNPIDVEAADLAEKTYARHLVQQAVVNGKVAK